MTAGRSVRVTRGGDRLWRITVVFTCEACGDPRPLGPPCFVDNFSPDNPAWQCPPWGPLFDPDAGFAASHDGVHVKVFLRCPVGHTPRLSARRLEELADRLRREIGPNRDRVVRERV